MRYVPAGEESIGSVVARTVLAPDGRPLLTQGTTLTESLLKRLRNKGFTHLYVEHAVAPDIKNDDAVTDPTRRHVQAVLFRALGDLAANQPLDVGALRNAVRMLIEDLTQHRENVLALVALRNAENDFYIHCVNVCIYALILGMAAGLHREDLEVLGLGAMLHDAGKLKNAQTRSDQAGAIMSKEPLQVRKHPEFGFDMLRRQHGLDLRAAHVAFQHHERINGTGYPRRLAGDEIHPFAKITAIADVYDNLTADRPRRPARLPHQAMAHIVYYADRHFERRLALAFFRRIALYPAGTVVKLQDDTIALVKAQTTHPSKPYARVIGTAGGEPLDHHDIDLREEGTPQIAGVLLDVPAALAKTDRNEQPPHNR